MNDEQDAMSKMSSEYSLERAKLDASKAEVLSAIEGEKNRIQVGVTEGALQQVKAGINAHQVGNEADLGRLGVADQHLIGDDVGAAGAGRVVGAVGDQPVPGDGEERSRGRPLRRRPEQRQQEIAPHVKPAPT